MKQKKTKTITNANVSSSVPNKLHFDIQRSTRMQIVQPKKGKGSYRRSRVSKSDY